MPVSNKNGGESDRLRPYNFHGVNLESHGNQATGDCPFCGREGKLSVEEATGLYRCFVCGSSGNGLTFTRQLYEASVVAHAANGEFVTALSEDRRLMSPATLRAWGVTLGLDGVTTLVPGYGPDGKLDQVYRRVQVQDKGEWSWRLLPTPGIWPDGKVHALHLPVGDFDASRPNVIVCEGPWDGMALWEVWGKQGETHNTNIVAVPGCNVWRDEWTDMCRGKVVTLMFDSDHPRQTTHAAGLPNSRVSRAGYDGMVRIAKKLSGVAKAVWWLEWGPDGYDPSKPSGYDVRDFLTEEGEKDRFQRLTELVTNIVEVPRDIFNPVASIINGNTQHIGALESISCHTFEKCEEAWKEAVRMRSDLSDALAVVLSVCASTQQGGNQLFLQLIASAGGCKTTLLDGLLVSRHCHHLEHLTGFHSGWKLAEDSSKDCSLISRINGKTLITPEADVLMSSPRFHEIMGQQRRIFDGKSGATYKNTDKDIVYSGLRTPWIMAGTRAMMDHDQSHLGDRFIRFIIEDPPEKEKREILRRAVRSERVAMLDTANGTAGSVVDPKTRLAQSLTGGYVDWLRANVEEELTKIEVPPSSEEYCIDLAELSADLRARPNEDRRKVETHDSKEMPTRLARQNIRLATCLAVVLNKKVVDWDVLRVVRKVALDTAAGHSLNIVQWLCSSDGNGGSYQQAGGLMRGILEAWTGMYNDRLMNYLKFLCKIDVLEHRDVRQTSGAWLLTDRVYDLYLRIMGGPSI